MDNPIRINLRILLKRKSTYSNEGVQEVGLVSSFDRSFTVVAVKNLIAESMSLPSNELKIFYGGQLLDSGNEATLEEVGIKENHTIFVVQLPNELHQSGKDVVPSGCFPEPSVVELRPNHGPSSGGTKVTIAGYRFLQSAICKFGVAIIPVTIVSDAILEVISPPHPPGPVSVEISNDSGRTWSAAGPLFHYHGEASSGAEGIPVRAEACWAGGERISILAPTMHFNWKPEGGGAA